jgi:RHS repeat-associated protein
MAAVSIVSICPALSDPGEIFEIGAPLLTSPAPKGADIHVGDASVSPTGAFQYSYPILVSPGRNGMQPSLALTYSSQGPIYGGVAAGWSLSGLPIITLDTSAGRMGSATKKYSSSMAGGRPLIRITEPHATDVETTYRAQNDSSWTRYERMKDTQTFPWRARTPDGRTYFFGEPSHITSCTIVSDEYAPLTRQIDKFGNAVDYFYKAGPENECHISYITWGQNAGAGIPGHFAAAVFGFTEMPTCGGSPPPAPIGSQISWRTGTKIATGTTRLTSITIAAFAPGSPVPPQVIPTNPDHTRVITLNYAAEAESCVARHSAYRALDSIQESAWGVDSPRVDLPAERFTYGYASFGHGSLAWRGQGSLPWPQPQAFTQIPWEPSIVPGINNGHYNLGWGYRFQNGQWPTVEAMMVDIDGDGRLDRLANYPEQNGGRNVMRCRAAWQRNQGLGVPFGQPQFIDMPTIKWATPPGTPTYQGGAYAGEHPSFGSNPAGPNRELCALNYQLSGYVNSFETGGGVSCPMQENCGQSTNWMCPTTHDDCSDKGSVTRNSILAFRWMDIDGDSKVDLVASPVKGGLERYNFQHGNNLNAPWEPAIFGMFGTSTPFPDCPSPTFTAYPGNPFPADPAKPYTMCGGMFPWMVYKNKGNGVFGNPQSGSSPLPDEIIYQAIPLESSGADSSITAAPVGQNVGTVDADGDNYVDAVSTDRWSVYRNDYQNARAGFFVPASASTPFFFGGALGLYLTRSDHPGFNQPVAQTEGLLDLNSDGLVDHWRLEASSTVVRLNNGVGFGAPYSLSLRPGNDGLPFAIAWIGSWITEGSRVDRRRPLDIDLDGRVDVLDDPTQGGQVLQTYFNQGGQFGGAAGQIANQTSLEHRILVSSYPPNEIPHYWPSGEAFAYSWEIRSDMVDLDGDGIPEGIDFGPFIPNPGQMAVWKVPTPTQPPRLLVGIDNQRGATTSVWYAPASNTAAVVQDAESGKTMPHPHWVVQSHTTTDTFDSPQTVTRTSYKYYDPRFSADDQGRYGLRGFEKIEVTLPSGAMRDDRYDFSIDWSGRLAKSIMHPGEALGEARTIDITSWQPRQLFNQAITTYHPLVREHLTCFNGQTEATCTPSTAAGYTKTSSTLTGVSSSLPGGGPPVMFQETGSLLQAGTVAGNGDRRTDREYFLYADPTNYRLVVLSETKLHQIAGSFTMFAKTAHKWEDSVIGDASYRVPYTDEVWVDSVFGNRAITRHAYDLTTGNVVKIWKPVQWAANENQFTNLNRTTLAYDARQLFPVTEVNELGHVRDYLYEYGTGTKLETLGPNVPTCAMANPHTCPAGAPLKETRRIRVDGLGRMIERFEAFGNDGTVYALHKVEINKYVDGPAPSITQHNAIDYNQSTQTIRYTQNKTELDGLGRPIRKTNYVFGSAPADHITTFQYSNSGTLSQVNAPDPSTNNSSMVSYTYTFDSLGKPTSIRRPDASKEADRSGADITYNGLSQTSTEFVGAALGERASTVTTTDVFERVVQVQEKRLESPVTWSVTTYSYGPNDSIKQITDAEGAITTLSHDFAGRRTAITRAGKTWTYGYDKNDNMISEQTPCTPVGSCEANYVTTITYDVLDRPSSKKIAPRNLSSADLELFGSGTETFKYDGGLNGKGRLSQWKSLPPQLSTPTVQVSSTYNAQGQQGNLTHTINAAGYNGLTRSFFRRYHLSGEVAETYYRDIVGTQNCQNGSLSSLSYDARGLPYQIQANTCLYASGAPYSYVRHTRNVAGLVTKRHTIAGSLQPSYVESVWSYDKLGRVIDQAIKKGTSLEQVTRQALTYFGNDNPKTLDHWLGLTNRKQFQHVYDVRHQLKTVTETELPNIFTATYAYGNAGRFASATESAAALPNSDVKARNVTYHYSASDPEQLVELKTLENETYAAYAYDPAGNLISLSYPNTNELWQYLYDGKNQLRRVTKRLNGAIQGSEEYWYDHNGARTLVVKRNASGTKTGMIWFIRQTEAHYDAAGVVTRVFGHVAMGTSVLRLDRNADAPSTVEYQFHGLADNTIATLDQVTGTINTSFVYAPFGEIIEATDAGAPTRGVAAHRRRFNDKFVDEISELAYYGFRYYDKTSMTWTQSDPLYRYAADAGRDQPPQANLYSSHLQNPLRYLDPDGREPISVICGSRGISGCPPPMGGYRESGPGLEVDWDLIAEVVDTVRHYKFGVGFLLDLDDSPNRNKPQSAPGNTPPMLLKPGAFSSKKPEATPGTKTSPTPTPTTQPKASKHPTDRAKESAGLGDALQRESSLSGAQDRARKTGKTYDDGTRAKRGGDATINSKKKTEQNTDNRLDRVRTAKDADDID